MAASCTNLPASDEAFGFGFCAVPEDQCDPAAFSTEERDTRFTLLADIRLLLEDCYSSDGIDLILSRVETYTKDRFAARGQIEEEEAGGGVHAAEDDDSRGVRFAPDTKEEESEADEKKARKKQKKVTPARRISFRIVCHLGSVCLSRPIAVRLHRDRERSERRIEPRRRRKR